MLQGNTFKGNTTLRRKTLKKWISRFHQTSKICQQGNNLNKLTTNEKEDWNSNKKIFQLPQFTNGTGVVGYPCLIPHFGVGVSSVSSFRMMLAVGFSSVAFVIFRCVFSSPHSLGLLSWRHVKFY